MINARNLRIGNIIKVKEEGHWFSAQVKAVFGSFLIAANPYIKLYGSYDLDNKVAPAKFSPDWLMLHGFQQIGNSQEKFRVIYPDHRYDNIQIVALKSGQYQIIIRDKDDNKICESRIFSGFHDLTNIWYELTNDILFTPEQQKEILMAEARYLLLDED